MSTSASWGTIHSNWLAVFGDAAVYESNVLVARTATVVSGTQVRTSSKAWLAYVAGAHYRDIEYVWEPGVANFGSAADCASTLACLRGDRDQHARKRFESYGAPKAEQAQIERRDRMLDFCDVEVVEARARGEVQFPSPRAPARSSPRPPVCCATPSPAWSRLARCPTR